MAAAIELRPHAASAVAWTASLGAVTAAVLARRERISEASARGRLLSAQRSGALVAWRPLRDSPTLYTVSRAGLRAVGLHDRAPARVSAGSAAHAIACCEVAVALELLFAGSRVAGEPELRRSAARAASAPAPAPGAMAAALCSVALDGRAAPGMHRADLAVLRGGGAGRPLAVEVELSVKEPRRLLAICTAWARARHVAGVLYVVTASVRPAVERAVAAARAQERIALVELDELVALTAPSSANAVPSGA
ncbi:MAG TPA: hypothetical protein VGD00_07160 [Solirubrobacteraceae bacterium]|jgi:hypothetical protein